MGGFPVDTDQLVRDYLDRLHAASTSLPPHRRAELVGEVRDHITAAVAEAGASDEVTIRNILERLGSPEEIVAGEAQSPPSPSGAVASGSTWGGLEIASVLLIGLAWPALFLPFGLFLWLGMGVVGVVLAWASGRWSTRQKLTTTVVVVALYAAFFVVITPARVVVTPVGSPIETTNQ
jgi:uncharacterized membrane protein